MPSRDHRFHAVAFLENFALRDLQATFPGARASVESMRVDLDDRADGEEPGALYLYPFGAVVFHNVPRESKPMVGGKPGASDWALTIVGSRL